LLFYSACIQSLYFIYNSEPFPPLILVEIFFVFGTAVAHIKLNWIVKMLSLCTFLVEMKSPFVYIVDENLSVNKLNVGLR
jgi:hypothetical protein